MVGPGLHVIERPGFKFISVDVHRARPGTVRRAVVVVGRCLILLDVRRHRHDHQRGFRQTPKELGKFRAHAVEVSAIGVQKLFFAGWEQLGVVGGGALQRLYVRKSQLMGNRQQLLLVLLYLVEADLVNLFRRQVGGGALLYQKAVVGFAIRQSPYAWIVAAAGDVLRLQKFAEAKVGRRSPAR